MCVAKSLLFISLFIINSLTVSAQRNKYHELGNNALTCKQSVKYFNKALKTYDKKISVELNIGWYYYRGEVNESLSNCFYLPKDKLISIQYLKNAYQDYLMVFKFDSLDTRVLEKICLAHDDLVESAYSINACSILINSYKKDYYEQRGDQYVRSKNYDMAYLDYKTAGIIDYSNPYSIVKINKLDSLVSETIKIELDSIKEIALKLNTYIYLQADVIPEFNGGEQARKRFLSDNIDYPQIARESGIEGTVYVSFIVEPDGKLSNITVKRGIGGGCDEEVIKVVIAMPKWKPGLVNGKAVRVLFNMPCRFTLQ
ncbi:energy transducer TonB [Bacteroidota bacterium]